MTIHEKLIELRACEEAREWATDKSIEEIWNTCHRGDWMLWLFKRTNPGDLRILSAYAADYTARKKSQQETDICRKYLPIPTI